MGILIALVPVVTWGSIGLVSGKMGGTAVQQTLGMTAGAVIFGTLTLFIYHPQLNDKVWIAGIISGLFWTIGQGQQFVAMKSLGVSRTIPLSTGLQLAGNALAGVLIFHEWTSSKQYILGTIAVIALIVGATLTSRKDKNSPVGKKVVNYSAGIKAIVFSTIGYITYTVIIKGFEQWGSVGNQTTFTHAVVFPQALGMFLGALIFVFNKRSQGNAFAKPAFKNILTGLFWGTGNLFMFLATIKVGLAIAYSLAQMGIIISTFGSIWFLGERKTGWEMKNVIIGSILIIAGGITLGIM